MALSPLFSTNVQFFENWVRSRFRIDSKPLYSCSQINSTLNCVKHIDIKPFTWATHAHNFKNWIFKISNFWKLANFELNLRGERVKMAKIWEQQSERVFFQLSKYPIRFEFGRLNPEICAFKKVHYFGKSSFLNRLILYFDAPQISNTGSKPCISYPFNLLQNIKLISYRKHL